MELRRLSKLRKLFFDEVLHKYIDEYGNNYTSMTTCIKKYTEEFKTEERAKACERIGRNPNHPDYQKYKGMSSSQLIKLWNRDANEGRDKGTKKHNYLENIINNANKFISSDKKYTGQRIYTIEDIKQDHDFGRIDVDYFDKSGLKEKYPSIYNLIIQLHNAGFKFYAEIGVFDPDRLISGLIDLLVVHHTSKFFIIIDWKTNKTKIMYKSGYFKKDVNRNITDEFVEKFETLYPPIDHLPNSIGHKYSLQVSGYAALVELFGYENKGNIICHIQDTPDGEKVNILAALDLRKEANIMFNDFHYNRTLNIQKKLFN